MQPELLQGYPYFPLENHFIYETGWEPLSSRRHSKKLTKACKIHYNLVPDYRKQFFQVFGGSLSRYNTHNTSDFSIPKCVDCKFLRNLLLLM